MRNYAQAQRLATFDSFQEDAQVGTLLRLVYRYLSELRFAETGEIHIRHLTQLYFSMTELLSHGQQSYFFLSDQSWPEKALFNDGSVTEILLTRTLAEKTLFLVKALDRFAGELSGKNKNQEARLVGQFTDYLQRILPERERPFARTPRARAVGF